MTKDKNIVQQDSTNVPTVWEPNTNMLKWLDAAEELGFTASITDIAKKSGVDRTTWYFWQNDENFVEWWDKIWKKYIKLHRHKLDLIGLKQAETDHTWWRDMKKVVGEPIPEDPIIPSTAIQNNNNIILTPEQIKRLTEE